MSNVFIILGKTASGKDRTVNELTSRYNFNKIITYTTRPMRKSEKQNITYHFISEDDFKQKIDDNFFAEWKTYNTEFGVWYYGTALEDLENTDDNSVIILTPEGYRDVANRMYVKPISILIEADDETIKNRLVKRGDNPKEAERRLLHDNEDFKGIENEVDYIIHNNDGTNINDVINEILKITTKGGIANESNT